MTDWQRIENRPAASADYSPIGRREWLKASSALLLAGCTGTATSTASATSASPSIPGGGEEIARLMRLASVPGMSIATVRGADITVEGYGVRRAGTQDTVTGDTVFEAASLSKPVLTAIVLQLAAEGLIEIEKPLGDYLALPNPADERAKTITAAHVLSHSGGWRNWRGGRDTTLRSDFPPGSRFSYSGEGFFFLQRVAEKLTGKGLSRLARERVFEPLGMRSSSFIWRPELDATLASPHSNRGVAFDSHHVRIAKAFRALGPQSGRTVDDWTNEDVERAMPSADANLPVLPNFLVPNAAASLMTSARDYGAFVRWLLGLGPVSGGRALLDRMLPQRVAINEALGWGLGVGIERHEGRQYFWHWGDNPGFKNFVIAEPASGSATVIFTNGNAGARVYERVLRARTGVDHPAFLWI
ncbi:MAG TPA: serine hydrolase domain-containing protein [Gemmatimonadaceae bacterium]|nr:serine hydrolase domain-containing protein [Gemmatimonadaceae bacterium]